jgi:hypothetical protein
MSRKKTTKIIEAKRWKHEVGPHLCFALKFLSYSLSHMNFKRIKDFYSVVSNLRPTRPGRAKMVHAVLLSNTIAKHVCQPRAVSQKHPFLPSVCSMPSLFPQHETNSSRTPAGTGTYISLVDVTHGGWIKQGFGSDNSRMATRTWLRDHARDAPQSGGVRSSDMSLTYHCSGLAGGRQRCAISR